METDNNFYVATSGALPWREPDNVTLPAIEWSSLAFSSSHFSRKAPVPDPSSLNDKGCLSSVLGIAFINQWLGVLVDELHLIAAEDGDTESVRDFKDFDGVALRGVARHIGGVESVVDAYELEELARLGERAARDVVVEEVVSV
eukprot:CAMPEP_0205887620 /NCGR_PEP_ID=MMETSP1083-20121108/19925_1 /ASSEMBLY_ACC=CAM_ASM_000430 /TAXON_ID=97485 /ORGANISM="Prymnesium parvum, Strain Texoma1" /LENGTH=143 /DNA_ID=CAMNT_0053251453 /DNA_START=534 /DNA_END=964 /DNA_ORIENTATION=-